MRGRTIYVGDIGDNAAHRPEIDIYSLRGADRDHGHRDQARPLHYADGPHDAEALLVDRDGTVVVVTKGLGGAGVYIARGTVLRRVAKLDLRLITAGDVSADGRTIVLRDYTGAYVWTARQGHARGHAQAPAV